MEVIKPIRQHVTAKLRVCAYARVSTDSADQLNSFASQVQYYTNYIESRADWELVDIYADRGITGTDAHKRDEFLRMMEDCRKRTGEIIIPLRQKHCGLHCCDSGTETTGRDGDF